MDSLVKERRGFKQHLAHRKGKISVVKQHEKLIEVNPDKNIKYNIPSNASKDYVGMNEFIDAAKKIDSNNVTNEDILDI